MNYSIKIKKVRRDSIISTGKMFIDVKFEIIGEEKDKKKVLEVNKLGFEPNSTEKQIEKELKKYLGTWVADRERKEETVAEIADDKKVDKVIKDLNNKEIKL